MAPVLVIFRRVASGSPSRSGTAQRCRALGRVIFVAVHGQTGQAWGYVGRCIWEGSKPPIRLLGSHWLASVMPLTEVIATYQLVSRCGVCVGLLIHGELRETWNVLAVSKARTMAEELSFTERWLMDELLKLSQEVVNFAARSLGHISRRLGRRASRRSFSLAPALWSWGR
jgi:hypothetical protein